MKTNKPNHFLKGENKLKKLFLITMAILLVASAAHGAVAYKYSVLYPQIGMAFPNIAQGNGLVLDSFLASISTPAYAVDLAQLQPFSRLTWASVVSAFDADVDTVNLIIRTSPDGYTWNNIKIQYDSVATQAVCTPLWGSVKADSLLQYVQIIERVWGNDADDAINTINISYNVGFFDEYGRRFKWINYKLPISYNSL